MSFNRFVLLIGSLAGFASSVSYGAATKLEIPLTGYYFVNNKEMTLNITKLNSELHKIGLDGLPESIVIGPNPKAFWNVIMNRLEVANKALGREMRLGIYDDNYGEGYIYKMTMCYRGDLAGVPKLIESMNGNFLNPNQGILAIAAGNTKVILDDAFKSRDGLKERFDSEYESNLRNINKWLKYDAKSLTAIVMSDYGEQGDGTELELTAIPPCK